jgi:hypothetical protein
LKKIPASASHSVGHCGIVVEVAGIWESWPDCLSHWVGGTNRQTAQVHRRIWECPQDQEKAEPHGEGDDPMALCSFASTRRMIIP